MSSCANPRYAGRRQIRLPAVASSVAVTGRADAADPLHEHQRRDAAGVPGLGSAGYIRNTIRSTQVVAT